MTPHAIKLDKFMSSLIKKTVSVFILAAFISSSVQSSLMAQVIDPMPLMPKPGVMVQLSPEFADAQLQGITIHHDNALQFDFLINKGNQALDLDQKKSEYKKLVKYFLASLTIPDEDQWVNLSPYEKDRIIKNDFGKTEMGRDLLAEDYILKQITSSLIYPEKGLGKKFWDTVYQRAWDEYHTTQIPVNTFNKVWIVPDQAYVYESGNSAYILNSHLKVMLEEDYLSLNKHSGISSNPQSPTTGNDTHTIGSQVIREIILPELEKEVNEGKNFANLRQMYSGMILATWYKNALKESLLGKVYADRAKVKGVDQNPKTNEIIYQRYLRAFKKGVFNYIKEDVDKYTNEEIPRKYFSGGWSPLASQAMRATQETTTEQLKESGKVEVIFDKETVFEVKPIIVSNPVLNVGDIVRVKLNQFGERPVRAQRIKTQRSPTRFDPLKRNKAMTVEDLRRSLIKTDQNSLRMYFGNEQDEEAVAAVMELASTIRPSANIEDLSRDKGYQLIFQSLILAAKNIYGTTHERNFLLNLQKLRNALTNPQERRPALVRTLSIALQAESYDELRQIWEDLLYTNTNLFSLNANRWAMRESYQLRSQPVSPAMTAHRALIRALSLFAASSFLLQAPVAQAGVVDTSTLNTKLVYESNRGIFSYPKVYYFRGTNWWVRNKYPQFLIQGDVYVGFSLGRASRIKGKIHANVFQSEISSWEIPTSPKSQKSIDAESERKMLEFLKQNKAMTAVDRAMFNNIPIVSEATLDSLNVQQRGIVDTLSSTLGRLPYDTVLKPTVGSTQLGLGSPNQRDYQYGTPWEGDVKNLRGIKNPYGAINTLEKMQSEVYNTFGDFTTRPRGIIAYRVDSFKQGLPGFKKTYYSLNIFIQPYVGVPHVDNNRNAFIQMSLLMTPSEYQIFVDSIHKFPHALAYIFQNNTNKLFKTISRSYIEPTMWFEPKVNGNEIIHPGFYGPVNLQDEYSVLAARNAMEKMDSLNPRQIIHGSRDKELFKQGSDYKYSLRFDFPVFRDNRAGQVSDVILELGDNPEKTEWAATQGVKVNGTPVHINTLGQMNITDVLYNTWQDNNGNPVGSIVLTSPSLNYLTTFRLVVTRTKNQAMTVVPQQVWSSFKENIRNREGTKIANLKRYNPKLKRTTPVFKVTRGGIDFNAANLNLLIKRDGHGVPLPLAQQDMAQLMKVQGFVPEIVVIKPAINVPIINELQQKLQS